MHTCECLNLLESVYHRVPMQPITLPTSLRYPSIMAMAGLAIADGEVMIPSAKDSVPSLATATAWHRLGNRQNV